jgi:hypothetical protein
LSGLWLATEDKDRNFTEHPLYNVVGKGTWTGAALQKKRTATMSSQRMGFHRHHSIIPLISSSQQKNCKVYKETGKQGQLTGKKNLTKTVSKEAQTLELTVRDVNQ